MKNKKFIVIIIDVLIALLIAGVIYLGVTHKKSSSNTSKTTTTNKAKTSEIDELLKKDHFLKNIVYGDIMLDEATVAVDGKTYYAVRDSMASSIDELMEMFNIYNYEIKYKIMADLGKYNEVIGVDGNLYVIKKDTKCKIADYDGEPKMIYKEKYNFLFSYKDKEYHGSVDGDSINIIDSPFNCD